MDSDRRADITCKLVMIGDSGVGKTSVMRRFTDDEFSVSFIATIGKRHMKQTLFILKEQFYKNMRLIFVQNLRAN